MRAGWNKATLGSLCKIYQPQTLTLKELDPNGMYDVFGANGVIGKHSKYNHENSELLMGCRGSCGALNYSSPFAWINGNAMVIHPVKEIVGREYLRYYLESIDKRSIISGTTIPQITAKSLSPIMVEYPSVQEQQRIVGVLDQEFVKIAALKAKAEKSFQAAKDLFQATLKKELEPKEGWITQELGDIADFKNGLNFGKEVGKCCYRFLGVGDFKDNLSVEVNNLGQIYKDEIDEDYLLKENDIVFVRSNGSKQLIGRCLLVKNAKEPAVFSGFCIRCRLKEKALLPQFLIHRCTMDETKTYLTSSGGGCNISNLNQKVLSSLKISAPQSITEQERIVSIIETHKKNCNTLQDNYKKTLTLCDVLKQALLRKAFNGEM